MPNSDRCSDRNRESPKGWNWPPILCPGSEIAQVNPTKSEDVVDNRLPAHATPLTFATKMIRTAHLLLLALSFAGCREPKPPQSSTLPENVLEDRPIIIKEGQAVILAPESNTSLMIGAAVVDGKLSVSEIAPKGRSFSVTWNDPESWETSTIDVEEDKTTIVIDKNGDGLPDLRAVTKKGSSSRFSLESPRWIEHKSEQKADTY